MIEWLRKRSLPTRILVYAIAALLTFAVAVSLGATAALVLQGELDSSVIRDSGSAQGQDGGPEDRGDADLPQQDKDSAARQEEAIDVQDEGISHLTETEYISRVGDIQGRAVETFLDSHDKLLSYDAITAQDVDEMQANETALEDATTQINNLAPPSRYEAHYMVFDSAVEELYGATRLAHDLAADPLAAAETGFDAYDERVMEAEDLLQRSNEMLGRDYRSIEGVREISPELGKAETAGGLDSA